MGSYGIARLFVHMHTAFASLELQLEFRMRKEQVLGGT